MINNSYYFWKKGYWNEFSIAISYIKARKKNPRAWYSGLIFTPNKSNKK